MDYDPFWPLKTIPHWRNNQSDALDVLELGVAFFGFWSAVANNGWSYSLLLLDPCGWSLTGVDGPNYF